MLNSFQEIETFNRVSSQYNQLLNASVEFSGESYQYFAEYKVKCLRRLGFSPTTRVLDYGCGIGNLTQVLCREFQEVTGFDPSDNALTLARKCTPNAKFIDQLDQIPEEHYDLVVIAGVLHHVPVEERPAVMSVVQQKLKPGGVAAIFEHNPRNPLTRRAVDSCPFDENAELLLPREITALLLKCGYSQIEQQYIVFFPRFLSWCRGLEPYLGFLPLGAQTFTYAIKPDTDAIHQSPDGHSNPLP